MQDRKIELLDFVLQPDNSGQLSSMLIENLKKLGENLKYGIYGIYDIYNISNPRQMNKAGIVGQVKIKDKAF